VAKVILHSRTAASPPGSVGPFFYLKKPCHEERGKA